MRADILAALALVDGAPYRRLQRSAEPPDAAGSRALRTVVTGRARDVFAGSRGFPRVAPLVRLPRATVFAVETSPPSACLFLITDLCDFQGHMVPIEVFDREGITLRVEPPLAGSLGLERVEWLPSGEVRWTERPVERPLGYF